MYKRGLLCAVVSLSLCLGCVGNIGPSGGGASGGGSVGGGPTPADNKMKEANPDLFAVSTKYFPSTVAATAAKRMVRLTRTQLDLTT